MLQLRQHQLCIPQQVQPVHDVTTWRQVLWLYGGGGAPHLPPHRHAHARAVSRIRTAGPTSPPPIRRPVTYHALFADAYPRHLRFVHVPYPPPSRTQIEEALLVFGDIAPDGIKLHWQKANFKQQRRGQMPLEGLALHAFCRFVRPASALAALQQGEIFILGQHTKINPAFMRGALRSETSAGTSDGAGVPPMPPTQPLPHKQQGRGDWGRPPAPSCLQHGGRINSTAFARADAVLMSSFRMFGVGGDSTGDGCYTRTTTPSSGVRYVPQRRPLGMDAGGDMTVSRTSRVASGMVSSSVPPTGTSTSDCGGGDGGCGCGCGCKASVASGRLNPAFMCGALPLETRGGGGMPPTPPMSPTPPLPHEQQGGGEWGHPPVPGLGESGERGRWRVNREWTDSKPLPTNAYLQ